MKYTITSPETEARLAVVDQDGERIEISTFDEKGAEHKQSMDGAKLTVLRGQLEIRLADGSRRLFPVAQLADGSMIAATALGTVKLLVTRGAGVEGAAGGKSAHKSIKSSMPGKVFKLLCKVGDQVAAGQPLLIIEAMKMENEIRASQGGVVEEIAVQPGQKVETGELLVKLGTGV